MTPEEKNALMQFMGTVYGESKKHDQMLVGQSTNLRPKSGEVKQQLEQMLRAPMHANDLQTQRPPAQEAQPLAVQSPVTPEQAAKELAQAQATQPIEQPIEQLVVDPNQMEFDLSEPSKIDRVIELLENQNKILLEIRDNSIKLKSNAKRAKNTKPQ